MIDLGRSPEAFQPRPLLTSAVSTDHGA
jgi:hypothetical protein